jgi:membrane protein implicated in regulation of membrane protease activity
MLPGGSAQEAVKVNGAFPELLMSARVTLVPLVATGQDDPGLSNYSAKVGFWAIPWILLALVLALILFAVGAWRWRRRRHRGPRAPQSGGPAPVTSGVEA